MIISKVINCPTCGKSIEGNEVYEFRPFCCERCKLIDFGEWANENHMIVGESVAQFPEDDNEGMQ